MNPYCRALLLFTTAVPLLGQNMISYIPGGAGASFLHEHPMPIPGVPATPIGLMPAPARPMLPHPRGSIAVDDINGVIYTTNGMVSIERSWYPRLGCTPPVVPLPALMIPAAIAQVTGMAVDYVTGNLFLADGATIYEVNPLGMIIVGLAGAGGWVVTDLEFDPKVPAQVQGLTNGGTLLTFPRPLGAVIGVAAPTYAAPGGIAVGLAMDRSVPGGAGHVFVLWNNGNVYDQLTGVLAFAGFMNHHGLTFIASPQNLPSAALCGGIKPKIRTSTLAVIGMPAFGFEVCDFPAGTPYVLLGLSLGAPAGPFAFGAGGTWWLPLPPPLFIPVFPPLGVTTERVPFPIPLVPALIGTQLNAQWFVPCPANPAGFALTDAVHVVIS